MGVFDLPLGSTELEPSATPTECCYEGIQFLLYWNSALCSDFVTGIPSISFLTIYVLIQTYSLSHTIYFALFLYFHVLPGIQWVAYRLISLYIYIYISILLQVSNRSLIDYLALYIYLHALQVYNLSLIDYLALYIYLHALQVYNRSLIILLALCTFTPGDGGDFSAARRRSYVRLVFADSFHPSLVPGCFSSSCKLELR